MAPPLFLLAPPRSYTSLINAMLGQHPQAFGLPELCLFNVNRFKDLWIRDTDEMSDDARARQGVLRAVAEIYAGEQTRAAVTMGSHWAAVREDWANNVRNAREGTAKLMRAGVTIGVGTDIWQIPTGVHMEMEQLVAAGMSPAQAIRAATTDAARILGAEKDLGTIEAGKRADLVILDADPLADIRNTRKIWNVIQGGHLIDRTAVIKRMKPR